MLFNEVWMDGHVLGRDQGLFSQDLFEYSTQIDNAITGAKCLVIGAAGTIGQSVTLELFNAKPASLHVVDISENNLVELVRTIRSTAGNTDVDFKTFAIDCASSEFESLVAQLGPYEFVYNLSALKHVRSEKDPFTLMRMIDVNILNNQKIVNLVGSKQLKKYFCVSTDKAANPTNMMGASKRIMELFASSQSYDVDISMARFANVAFSDGSLLHGFTQRLVKRQPLSAPSDVRRYFVTKKEAGELCLMSSILGGNREIFFPKLDEENHTKTFSEIAVSFLKQYGYDVLLCETEQEARRRMKEVDRSKRWPCFFFKSDTTGEKKIEEFYMSSEVIDLDRFYSMGVVKNLPSVSESTLNEFLKDINMLKENKIYQKHAILEIFRKILPNFEHVELEKNLDDKM